MLFISTRAAVSGRTLARRPNSFLNVWSSMCLIRSCKLCQREKKVPSDSAITKLLKASVSSIADAMKRFSVLVQARSGSHLDVLEALLIDKFKPALCNQKGHVRTLSLFWISLSCCFRWGYPHLGFFTCHVHYSQSAASGEYVFVFVLGIVICRIFS